MTAGAAAKGCPSIYKNSKFSVTFTSSLAFTSPPSMFHLYLEISLVKLRNLSTLVAAASPIYRWLVPRDLVHSHHGCRYNRVGHALLHAGDLGARVKFQASRQEKAKYDWKVINAKDGKRYWRIKILILALTSLYAPASRNAIQRLCAQRSTHITTSSVLTEQRHIWIQTASAGTRAQTKCRATLR